MNNNLYPDLQSEDIISTAKTELVQFSKITSTVPDTLTKEYRLEAGELIKSTVANLVEGEVSKVFISSIQELKRELKNLRKNQAIMSGITRHEKIKIVTEKKWCSLGKPEVPIPRTKEHFCWPEGPALLILDHDVTDGLEVLKSDDLVDSVRKALGHKVSALWWVSSSSHITNEETGVDLTGLRGQRLYLLISDGQDIPRVGKHINEYAWSCSYGGYQVSKSGALLERPLFDISVLQTNHLDFAAGANCQDPLTQKRGEPVLFPGEIEIIDTVNLVRDLPKEVKERAEENRKIAREDKVPEAKRRRQKWVSDRLDSMIPVNASEEDINRVKSTLHLALDHKTLEGDFKILVKGGDGKFGEVTVDQILANPTKYHECETKDPLEPDYDGGRTVGKIYADGASINLHSFAHGGCNYKLLRAKKEIEIIRGKLSDAVIATWNILRKQQDIFEFCGSMVLVVGGNIHYLDEHSLSHYLGRVIQYFKWKNNREPERVTVDPPIIFVKQLLSLVEIRGLKKLKAVITAPTLLPDGSVLDTPGYHEESCVFLQPSGGLVPITQNPNKDEITKALDFLLNPFRNFPLIGPEDWGVLLAAQLTVVSRLAFPTCPGFGFDAPIQGSGKTLLASCIGALATGQSPQCYPQTNDKTGEELRKRFFAALLRGEIAIIFDNIVGAFDSPSIAAILTAEKVSDRKLGASEIKTITNNSILILTGNNLTLKGDMFRRVLKARIDPRTDRPYAREFNENPLQIVLQNRQKLTSSALTLIRGYLCSNAKRAEGRMASFERWDDIVRQTVVWIGREIDPGKFADPMKVIDVSKDFADEALSSMLRAWKELMGDRKLSSKELIIKLDECSSSELADLLQDLGGYEVIRNTQKLGKFLSRYKDRVSDGLRLEQIKDSHTKTALWYVTKIQ